MGKKKGKKRTTNNGNSKPKKPLATLPPPSTPGTKQFNAGLLNNEDAAIPLPASYSEDVVEDLLATGSDLLVSASVEEMTTQQPSLLPEDLVSTAMNAGEDAHDETFYTTAEGDGDDSDDIVDDDKSEDLIQLDSPASPSFKSAPAAKKKPATTPVAAAADSPAVAAPSSTARNPRKSPGSSFWTEAMASQETPKVATKSFAKDSPTLDDVATMTEISAQVTPKVATKGLVKATPAPYDEVSTSTPEKTEANKEETKTPKKNSSTGGEPDVALHLYGGVKGAWAWSKSHIPLADVFMGVTETVASTITKATTGTSLKEIDGKIIIPKLTGFDNDMLNPVIHATVDAILDDKEPQNPVQKFVFAPLRPPVRALIKSD